MQFHDRLTVFFTKKHGKDSVLYRSQLQLVDLAGSEATAAPERSPLTSKALASVGQVVKELHARRPRTSIKAYSDSKLTQLLAPGLGGCTAILVVANVVANEAALNGTLDTLAFGLSLTELAPDQEQESKQGSEKSHALQQVEAGQKLLDSVIDLKIDVESNLDECTRMHAGYEGVDELLKMKCLSLDQRCNVLEQKRRQLIHDEVG